MLLFSIYGHICLKIYVFIKRERECTHIGGAEGKGKGKGKTPKQSPH